MPRLLMRSIPLVLLFVLSLSLLLFNTNPATPSLALVVIEEEEEEEEVVVIVAMIDSTNARRLGWRR